MRSIDMSPCRERSVLLQRCGVFAGGLALVFGLTACGGGADAPATATSASAVQPTGVAPIAPASGVTPVSPVPTPGAAIPDAAIPTDGAPSPSVPQAPAAVTNPLPTPAPMPSGGSDSTPVQPTAKFALQSDGERRFPAALIANVRDYGAKGDGVTDDGAAIQQTICENIGRRMVYFPNGTYRVTRRLEGKDCSGKWTPFLRLIGQERDRVTIVLADGATGFGNAANPRAVIHTASGEFTGGQGWNHPETGAGNEAFGNYVEHLTVDAGNNAGAIGIDFAASNWGAVRDVAVRGQGTVGLSLARAVNGPLLVKKVSIDGFNVGLLTAVSEYGATIEHVHVSHQRSAGLRNEGGALAVRGYWSINRVPAIVNVPSTAQVVMVDARLEGGAAGTPAIINPWDENRYHKASLFLRNVRTEGYAALVKNGDEDVIQTEPAEYSTLGQQSLFPSRFGSLNLPVRETPLEFHDNDLSQWANVIDYGAVTTQANGTLDWGDDSDAIQRALDSGRATVYLPAGTYFVYKPLHVPATVRRIFGPHATLSAWQAFRDGSNPQGLFKVDTDGALLTIEGVSINNLISNDGQGPLPGLIGVDHSSARTVLLKDFGCCNLSGGFRNSYRGTGGGTVFIENVSASKWAFGSGQTVFARQFNPEGAERHVVNDGALLWVLGFKVEGRGQVIRTQGGGATEVLGGAIYSFDTFGNDEAPFESTDSRMSLAFSTTIFSAATQWPNLVRETRSGVSRALPNAIGEWRGYGQMLPLFVGAAAPSGESYTGEGTGLTGSYFDKPDFTDRRATRIDPVVDFDWKSWFTPIAGIDHTQNYSIRWTGKIEVPVAGEYTFSSTGDYFAALWIDGQPVVGTQTFGGSGRVSLQAGRRYDLRLDFKGGGSSWVKLRWQGPGMPRAVVVPRAQLYPN